MILRDFKKEDAHIIAGWLRSEDELYQWSFYPLTAVDDNGDVIGHFIIRYPKDNDDSSVRFGFVIVNPAKRGKGYGKEMLWLAIEYVKDHLNATRIELGVFENNERARHCYEAVGFTEYARKEYEMPIGIWNCYEMEMFLKKSPDTMSDLI